MGKKIEITLEQVIELLKKEYERAIKMDFVKRPLPWALYHVWKYVDEATQEGNVE